MFLFCVNIYLLTNCGEIIKNESQKSHKLFPIRKYMEIMISLNKKLKLNQKFIDFEENMISIQDIFIVFFDF
jgi:hypothetical protein